ncbi:hypothetical protein Salat_2650600 [Sesamum alatum]|uniref:Uncharacterized protein n=1 Tax=Sesamum alatum TaxID=300844 RepID=A0AAE1XP06_9LAMI|nr:hypothetical protein Salat_2650600 [Sesamum alatum]
MAPPPQQRPQKCHFYSGRWMKSHDVSFINALYWKAEKGFKQDGPRRPNKMALLFAVRAVTRMRIPLPMLTLSMESLNRKVSNSFSNRTKKLTGAMGMKLFQFLAENQQTKTSTMNRTTHPFVKTSTQIQTRLLIWRRRTVSECSELERSRG